MKSISNKLENKAYKYLVVRTYQGTEEIITQSSNFIDAVEHIKGISKKHTKSNYAIFQLAGDYWIFE